MIKRQPAGLASLAMRQLYAIGAAALLLVAGVVKGRAEQVPGPATAPPPMPSATGAPGDPSGMRVVHEFLYGESPECSSGSNQYCEKQPGLCVPSSWLAHEICETCNGPDGCSPFFRDARTLPQGKDTDPGNGIEGATLVLYAGHGDPGDWDTVSGSKVQVSDFSVGDGQARYWWMVSCNVMAHGPAVQVPGAAAGDTDYLAPERFTDNVANSLNVFATWAAVAGGPASAPRIPLNRNLRMACGGSSKIGGGSPFPTAAVWHYKLLAGLPVADAFTLGLATGHDVPLCISRGGADREKSPLYEQEFVTNPNQVPGDTYVYIQYPIHHPHGDPALRQALAKVFSLPDPPAVEPQGEPPSSLPILLMDPTPVPLSLRSLPWQSLPALLYGFKGGAATHLLNDPPADLATALKALVGPSFKLEDLCVKKQAKSGAVVLSWRPLGPPALDPALTDVLRSPAGLIGLAGKLQLTGEQWTGHGVVDGVAPLLPEDDWITMEVDGTKEQRIAAPDFKADDVSKSSKCTYVRLNARLSVGGTTVPVFGEGAQWLLSGCPPQGTGNPPPGQAEDACSRKVPPVFTAAWVGRQVRQLDARPPGVLSVAEARSQALAKLARIADGAAYHEVAYRWGYKAAPIHCLQGAMVLVYEFEYRHNPSVTFKNYPPITVEVPAHRGFQPPSDKKIEDTWSCSPEAPES